MPAPTTATCSGAVCDVFTVTSKNPEKECGCATRRPGRRPAAPARVRRGPVSHLDDVGRAVGEHARAVLLDHERLAQADP